MVEPRRIGSLTVAVTMRGFLGEREIPALLALAQSCESNGRPTRLGGGQLDPSRRHSVHLGDLGDFRTSYESRIRSQLLALRQTLELMPFEPSHFQTELVGHGDGAFYSRHIDTAHGPAGSLASQRVLSTVYYFHHQPKAFTGGALRLFGLQDPSLFIDVEPEHDLLVAFPAFLPHAVMPVACPSGRFLDWRFAINCWVFRSIERSPGGTAIGA